MLYSLSFLTIAELDPLLATRIAARTGYGALGLRAAPAGPGGAYSELVGHPSRVRDLRIAATELGVRFLDLEIIRIGEGFDPARAEPLFALAGDLGIASVTVVIDDTNEARATNGFYELCVIAARNGTCCGLEYMPRTGIAGVRAAVRVVTNADHPAGRILFDPLHTARTYSTTEDLVGIPAHLLDYLQICDAPAAFPSSDADLLFAARSERLLPGEGELDLAAMFVAMPSGRSISVEIPSVSRVAALGAEAWARMALTASKGFIQTAYASS